jgi:hypothetical protein
MGDRCLPGVLTVEKSGISVLAVAGKPEKEKQNEKTRF